MHLLTSVFCTQNLNSLTMQSRCTKRCCRLKRVNSKNTDALNFLGYSYADRGIHLEEALSLIQRALEVKPGNGYILDSLGWVYFKLGKNEDALRYLLEATEGAKDDPVFY